VTEVRLDRLPLGHVQRLSMANFRRPPLYNWSNYMAYWSMPRAAEPASAQVAETLCRCV